MDIDERKESGDMAKNPPHYELEGVEPYQSIDINKLELVREED